MEINELLKIILPVILTVIGNIIIYWIIKNRVDKILEQNKITYSGVFKEKIEIYKSLLQQTYDLKRKIKDYQFEDFATIEKLSKEIWNDFNSFVRFYSINKLFLSDSILNNSKKLKDELQKCFTDFEPVRKLKDHDNLKKDETNKIIETFLSANKKLLSNDSDSLFIILENDITKEIKKDLQIK